MTNIGCQHTLKSLADIAGMSARSLTRHFVRETGVTPHRFVENARIDAARKLLEGSDRSLKAVAYNTGFGTADRMRIIFNDRLGMAPVQYRTRFRFHGNGCAARNAPADQDQSGQ
jgi:transcriptional regulator GlxA family with amidase domain